MTPRAGVVIGRWELTRLIAVGGMGQVWAAQEKPGGREVAVKVLRPEFAGERLFLDRIAAEARNSLTLVHPGIARTYAHGELDGLGYIVMELVPGEPLSTILARERVLARRLVLDIMAQTADALSAAHNAGVVHRDIKPANLILGPGGRVVLTDFGISIAANQAPMTAAGMVMGTAQYLPPEQAMGRAATGAGDLYALGIIAYESLVGKRPFTGATQVDIAFAHVTDPVPPLPATIDERVRTLVEGLLEKEPTRRPSPAAHVAARARELASQVEPDDAWDISQPKSGSLSDGGEPRHARRRRYATHAAGTTISDELDGDVAPTITTGRPRPPQPRLLKPRETSVRPVRDPGPRRERVREVSRETPGRTTPEAGTRRAARAAAAAHPVVRERAAVLESAAPEASVRESAARESVVRESAGRESAAGVSEARSAHALLPEDASPPMPTPDWHPVHGSGTTGPSGSAAPVAGARRIRVRSTEAAGSASARPESARPESAGPASTAAAASPGAAPRTATATDEAPRRQPLGAPRDAPAARVAATAAARSQPETRSRAQRQRRPAWLLALVVVLVATVVTIAVLVLGNLGQSGERADAWDQARTTIGEVQ